MTGSNDCHMNAMCNNIAGSFICNCSHGYTGNGTFCEGLSLKSGYDLCFPSVLILFSIWHHHIIMKFLTHVHTKPILFLCTEMICLIILYTDIDECEMGTDQCHEDYGICDNTDGGHNCSCKNGFTGNGTTCESKDMLQSVTCVNSKFQRANKY